MCVIQRFEFDIKKPATKSGLVYAIAGTAEWSVDERLSEQK
jgi:hypothetical protein